MYIPVKPLISVIIPVYKVEQYLHQCLDSVLSQTFVDYECILVDDGSPDNSPTICDEYAKKDSRFKVIHKKENEGLPMARKSGLDIAASDYVFHLDSDDWIEPYALEVLYRKQKETGAKIVIGNFRLICSGSIKEKKIASIMNYENPIEWFLLCKHKFLWGKLYDRTLYNGYIVPQINIFEDGVVNIQLFSKLAFNQIQFIDSFIYNYNVKVENRSLITQLRSERYDSYIEHPMIKAHLYIYDIFKNLIHKDVNIYSAYNYSFLNAGIPYYLRGNIKIKKKDVHSLYNYYYKKCSHRHLMKVDIRFFFLACNFSIVFGKMYIFAYNFALKIRDWIER